MNWFLSDTHFHHAGILVYCKRPFASVEEMNREMVGRWRDRVGSRDVVYFLGDFAMGQRYLLAPTRKKLPGKIILIRGNHDRSQTAMLEAGFDEVHNELRLSIDGKELYLRHRPAQDWRGAQYHLHGHVHTEYKRRGNAINVGVDVWDFTPRTLAELLGATDECMNVTRAMDPQASFLGEDTGLGRRKATKIQG